jgi:hypothetical protein
MAQTCFVYSLKPVGAERWLYFNSAFDYVPGQRAILFNEFSVPLCLCASVVKPGGP